MRTALLMLATVALLASPSAAKEEKKNGVTGFIVINGTEDLAITICVNGGEVGTLEPGELLPVAPISPGIHLVEVKAEVGEQTFSAFAFCEAIEGVITFVAVEEETPGDPSTLFITCNEPEEFGGLASSREMTIALLACCGLCLVYGSAALVARRG